LDDTSGAEEAGGDGTFIVVEAKTRVKVDKVKNVEIITSSLFVIEEMSFNKALS
jgi:hypothetical protein